MDTPDAISRIYELQSLPIIDKLFSQLPNTNPSDVKRIIQEKKRMLDLEQEQTNLEQKNTLGPMRTKTRKLKYKPYNTRSRNSRTRTGTRFSNY